MKEELLKNLAGILDYVKQEADFIKEQAPLFIQEFITYKYWLYCFEIILSVVMLISSIFIFKKGYKDYKEDEYSFPFLMFIGGAGILFAFFMFGYSLENLIEIHFAPRYFLIEHLLSLGK